MADALVNQKEVQRTGSNETESGSNEETKAQAPDMRASESGTRSDEQIIGQVRYDRDTRFWDENKEEPPDRDPIKHARFLEEKLQELRDAGMQHRRGDEALQRMRQRYAERQQRRSIEATKGKTIDMRPSGSGTMSDEKAVVRYDRDTRFWEEYREYLESRSRVNEALQIPYLQQQRVRDTEMQQRRANETESILLQQKNREYECSGSRMNEAGPIRESYIRENHQHRLSDFGMQQRRSHETEWRGKNLDMRPSESGKKAVVRYDRDTRFWDWEENREYLESAPRVNEAVQRVIDAEMQAKRSRETESIFNIHREYECSGSRMNEAGPIRESYIRENQQQQQHRPRDFGRSHETEWSFQQQHKRARAPDWRGSPDWGYKRRRFDERRHETEEYPNGDCHFYVKNGWCVNGIDCVFNHPTPGWRFDERRHETEESRYLPQKMARTVYGRGRFDEGRESGYGDNTLEERQRDNIWWKRREAAPENVREQRDSTAGWLRSYEERWRNPANREILMRLSRRVEQRERERQVRNEGAHNRESSPELGTERK